MRSLRPTLSLLRLPLWRRLDRSSTRLVNGRPARPRRTVLRAVVWMVGPRRVIEILHEAGAVYPCWGSDANGSPFFGWVESKPPEPDQEADRG